MSASNPVPKVIQHLIRYDEEWKVFICVECEHEYAVLYSSLSYHLYKQHGFGRERIAWVKSLGRLPHVETEAGYPLPPNGHAPIDGLKVIKGTLPSIKCFC